MGKHSSHALTNDVDPISLERFDPKFGIMLNKKLYNGRQLVSHLKHGSTDVPHSRRQLTPEEYKKIMSLGGKVYRHTWNAAKGHDPLNAHRYSTKRTMRRLGAAEEGRTQAQAVQASKLVEKLRKKIDAKLQQLQREFGQPNTEAAAFAGYYIQTLQAAINKMNNTHIDMLDMLERLT